MEITTACIMMAKGRHATENEWADRMGTDAKQKLRSDYYNNISRFAAEEGNVPLAEQWLDMMINAKGLDTEVNTLNAVILSAAKSGDLEKAEAWITKAAHSILHPEFDLLKVNEGSFDIMIQASAQAGDVARAEKYMNQINARGLRPALRSQYAVIRLLLKRGDPGEVRRANFWFLELVKHGCSKCPSYSPAAVREERKRLRSRKVYDVDEYKDMVVSLIKALADVGNVHCADTWLQYLTESGIRPVEEPDAWEYVRAAHPERIVPSVLSGESPASPAVSLPSRRRPMVLSGEKRNSKGAHEIACLRPLSQAERPFSEGAIHGVMGRPFSQASARPETALAVVRPATSLGFSRPAPSNCARSARYRATSPTAGFGRQSPERYAFPPSPSGGRTSPGLRMLLDARNRGAKLNHDAYSASARIKQNRNVLDEKECEIQSGDNGFEA